MTTQPEDPTLAVEHVRLLIADVDASNQLLTDDQITAYLELNEWGVRRSAADALDAIASSEALISRKIRTQDLQTDGPAVADALRKHADRLRDQADKADDDDGWFGFDVVDTLPSVRHPELTDHIVWGL